MTPIQFKINELEQEYDEFGHPLNTTLWELQVMIREYAEERGLGSIQYTKEDKLKNGRNTK